MEDFAGLVLEARARKGLTQAEAATAAGLTPSYLSLIENRKKPPPSDEVCRRLAKVLAVPEERMLEVAHLERAPAPLRNRLRSMATAIRRERKSVTNVLRGLLAPFLLTGPPGLLDGALDTTGLNPRRRRRLRDVLGVIGTSTTAAEDLDRLIETLPERERTVLLDGLTRLLSRRDPARSAIPSPGAQPGAAVTESRAPGRAPQHAPELLYAAPRLADAPATPYLLEIAAVSCAGVPELEAGDLVLVDAHLLPRTGDLLVFVGGDGPLVRRMGLSARPAGGTGPHRSRETGAPTIEGPDFAAQWERTGAGVVTEIRRRLRRAPPVPGE